jgi:hypothetical protein
LELQTTRGNQVVQKVAKAEAPARPGKPPAKAETLEAAEKPAAPEKAAGPEAALDFTGLPLLIVQAFRAADRAVGDRGAGHLGQAQARLHKLQVRQKGHEPLAQKISQIKEAVRPPTQEAQSRTNARQVEAVSQMSAPPAKAEVTRTTVKDTLEDITPRTLEDVAEFKNRDQAGAIRSRVLQTVREQTDAVKATYDQISQGPQVAPAKEESPAIPPPEATPSTAPLQLGKGLITPLPPEATHYAAVTAEVDQQMAQEGLSEDMLAQVDSGPLQEFRQSRQELQKTVAQAPAQLREKDAQELAAVDKDLQKGEKEARNQMQAVRTGALGTVRGRQQGAQKDEEQARQQVTDTIQNIYLAAKKSVEDKLARLEQDSLQRFDQGQGLAIQVFEDRVNREFKAFKDRRYSGLRGKARWVADLFRDVDELPEVKAIFDGGRKAFIREMDGLIGTITAAANQVIADCKAELQAAQERIAGYVGRLEPKLRTIGEQAKKAMTQKLEALRQKVDDKARELSEQLAKRREQAIQAVDAKIAKMKEKLKNIFSRAAAFIKNAARKFFEWVMGKFGAAGKRVIEVLQKAGEFIMHIFRHPVDFLKHLVGAVKQGFIQFKDNIVVHLKAALLGWLFGTMAEAGITIPQEFSLKAIFGLVMEVLGLTYQNIRKKAVKIIGEKNVERLEQAWHYISTLIKEGPAGLWEEIKEYLTGLKETILDAVRNWVIVQIVKAAIATLISLFNPVSAIIKAIQLIYRTIKFFIDRWQQIVQLVEAVFNSLSDIVAGAIGKAADWIEKTMARALTVIISFLAGLLGLGGIAAKIREIITKIHTKVDQALDKVIAKITSRFRKDGKPGKLEKEEAAKPELGVAKDTVKDALSTQLPSGARQVSDVTAVLAGVAPKVKPALTNLRAEEVLPGKPKAEGALGFKVKAKEERRADVLITIVRYSQAGTVVNPEDRWKIGVAGVKRGVDQLAKREISENTIKAQLPRWQSEFGFKILMLNTKQTPWIIEGEMSPAKKVIDITPPGPSKAEIDAKITEAKEARSEAIKVLKRLREEEFRGKEKKTKTVACAGGRFFVSGWARSPESYLATMTRVFEAGKEREELVSVKEQKEMEEKRKLTDKKEQIEGLEYDPTRKGGADWGVPGKSVASHAEKQAALFVPNTPIGVTRGMCSDCRKFFPVIAMKSKQIQVVADPNVVRVFHPDKKVDKK